MVGGRWSMGGARAARALALICLAVPACGGRSIAKGDAGIDRGGDAVSDADRASDGADVGEVAELTDVAPDLVDVAPDMPDSPDVVDATAPLTAAAFIELRNALSCKKNVECGYDRDESVCNFDTDVWDGTVLAGVADGHIKFDPDSARACLAHRASWPCLESQRYDDTVFEPCRTTFIGTKKLGEGCFFNQDCVLGAGCLGTDRNCSVLCCPGRCISTAGVPAGGDCSAPDAICADYLRCVQGPSGRICAPFVGLDANCTNNTCTHDLVCLSPAVVNGIASGEPRCQKYATTGEPCLGDGWCDDTRDYCDRTKKVCTRHRRAGDRCEADGSGCGFGTGCRHPEEVCRNFPVLGDTCDDQNNYCIFFDCDPATRKCVPRDFGPACDYGSL